MQHGWTSMHPDPYDQYYYRTWMHELPPMQHIKRMTVIDVHHAIMPESARLHPDSSKLRTAAQQLGGSGGFRVLAPADMVLHSAVHLFYEGDFENGLRDLVDIDALLRHFGDRPEFWPELIRRGHELVLMRPLYYALRYATRCLDTPVPAASLMAARAGRPAPGLRKFMDALFERALLPNHASCRVTLAVAARAVLYLRAHWLRMPPLLLARHLFHKAVLSPRQG